MKTFSNTFNEQWLFETPITTGPAGHNPYSGLLQVINANIEAGTAPEPKANGLYKIDLGANVFYWLEHDNVIKIITEFKKVPQGLYIELTGKLKGSDIYASNFYELVLQDAGKLIFSGDVLSDEGFNIWKRLLDTGRRLFVFDMNKPLNRIDIDSADILNKYLGNTSDYRRYRYVLSENIKHHTIAKTSFDLLRLYNLTFNQHN